MNESSTAEATMKVTPPAMAAITIGIHQRKPRVRRNRGRAGPGRSGTSGEAEAKAIVASLSTSRRRA